MPNSYRLRTEPGVDKDVQVLIEQDFDFLEILSLKITQSEIYARMCSDYGVVVGRVIANNGYGVPNAKVSIFIPLSTEDENNPIISELYPYKSLADKNVDGYRYNLLPYTASYSNHNPTGTFPDREDVLINKSLIEVYDKYYKFTVRTNDSGDFMIFGVPVGSQTLVMDLDLSDMGPFSLSPQDLVRMGMATESQIGGIKFSSSSNLDSLPQLVNIAKEIEVLPFWGQPEVCQLAITRTDFDLVKEINLDIQPTSIFMGSIVSTLEKYAIKKYKKAKQYCKVRGKSGELCSMVTGPGEILAIRQTIDLDVNGQPVLESVDLEDGGKVIDENGTWLIDLPLNLDYVYTNEFGQQVISNDPNIGIPTKGKYRFKIKWQQPNTLDDPIRRAYFLVPNIREYGWTSSANDPLINSVSGNNDYDSLQKSYAFSLDWNEYVDPAAAISCEDYFFEFDYNQVYTISQLIDQYRGGVAPRKIMSVKHILDDTCESTNNTFPVNDAQYRPDFIYILFSILIRVLTPVFIAIIAVIHVLGFLLQLISPVLYILTLVVNVIISFVKWFQEQIRKIRCKIFGSGCNDKRDVPDLKDAEEKAREVFNLPNNLKNLNLPNLTFPDCEMCNCNVTSSDIESGSQVLGDIADSYQTFNVSQLSNWNSSTFYDGIDSFLTEIEQNWIPEPDNLRPTYCGTEPQNMYLPTDFINPIQSILAGRAINVATSNTIKPSVDAFMPYYQDDSQDVSNYSRRWFSTNLTIAERLNLFNTKSKYFDINLPGSNANGNGVNQIKVSFNYTGNTNSHLDNVMVLSCDPGSVNSLTAGAIVYFQNPNKSADVNCFSASTNNQYGIPSITGSSVNTSPSININVTYADPFNPNSTGIVVPYTVLSNTADTQFHTFPFDIEYFQVITAMTISDFGTMSNPTNGRSLWKRYLNNPMRLRVSSNYGIIRPGVYRTPTSNWSSCRYQVNPEFPDNPSYTPPPLNGSYCGPDNTINGTPWETVNPLTASTQGYNQILVFLVRGVDPYSTRNENSYNLGRLFGYDYTDPNAPIVTGQYKLNIPIQPKLKNARHDFIYANVGVNSIDSGYSSTGIFYENFNYLPSTTDFSGFTTTLHGYYSALDSTKFGYDISNVTASNGQHIYYQLQGSNAYTDPIYGDIRIQGPRFFQKHTSSTTLGNYWQGSNMILNSIDYTNVYCQQDEIVWPQRNPQISLNGFDSTNVKNSNYYGQDFNIFTCDYTVHKSLYGYEGILANRIFRNTTNNCNCGNSWIDANGNSYSVGNPFYLYTLEPDGNWTPKNTNLTQNMGYYNDESVEGGSLFGGKWYWYPQINKQLKDISCPYSGVDNHWVAYGAFNSAFNYEYFAPTYDVTAPTFGLFINIFDGSNISRKTVMRSDRLPTSTSVTRLQNNSFALHQNPSFLILTAPDSGVQSNGVSDVSGVNTPVYDTPETTFTTPSVTDSLNDCGKMVQLDCYDTSNNQITIPNTTTCNEFTTKGFLGLGAGTYTTFDYGTGCYRLVQRFLTGLPHDIELLLEWKSRLDLTFGACRNVFGHMFTNNWVNGTLFVYSYKNDKFFDAQNKAYYEYCKDTIVFHDATNNHYYRSSPYNSNNQTFIGKRAASTTIGSQNYNLNNPTTILNLGPRNSYLNELVLSNQFDGYVVDRLKESTFSDTSDILNLFILSRLANSNLFSKLIGGQGAGILGLFTREPWDIGNLQAQKNIIDADFAQLISITSEIGVPPYEEDNGGPIYFNSTSNTGKDTVIGLYFSGDNQVRDYISPRRTIYVENQPQPYPVYDFNYIPVKTQLVPFYGWIIKPSSTPSIFGSQQNDWNVSSPTNGVFPAYFYQKLDRLNQTQVSNYMTSTINTQSQYLKGYIYNVNANGDVDPTLNVNPSSSGNKLITNGAPFHFYFGLIKGATAYDRFATKWIKGELI